MLGYFLKGQTLLCLRLSQKSPFWPIRQFWITPQLCQVPVSASCLACERHDLDNPKIHTVLSFLVFLIFFVCVCASVLTFSIPAYFKWVHTVTCTNSTVLNQLVFLQIYKCCKQFDQYFVLLSHFESVTGSHILSLTALTSESKCVHHATNSWYLSER